MLRADGEGKTARPLRPQLHSRGARGIHLSAQRDPESKESVGFVGQDPQLLPYRHLGLRWLAKSQKSVREALVAQRAVDVEGQAPLEEPRRCTRTTAPGGEAWCECAGAACGLWRCIP